jgi:hypothetical protein
MTDKTAVELSNETWNTLLAMALEHPVPRHVALAAIQTLQKALIDAANKSAAVVSGEAADGGS